MTDPNRVIEGVEFFEYPFVRKGMTEKEFDEEIRYLGTHLEEYKEGTYVPLWKQRESNGI